MEKHAGEIMSRKLVTVRFDDSVRKAYQIMLDGKFRHLPVVDEQERVIGILSDRDLQRAMTPQADPSSGLDEAVEFDGTFQAKDFMAWPARTVSREAPIEDVARRMLTEKVSAYLVADHGSVCGIVTSDDLLRLLAELLEKVPGRLRMSLGTVMGEFRFGVAH